MALTWVTIIGGVLVVFGLPIAVAALNARRKALGWLVLAILVAALVLGNVIESATK